MPSSYVANNETIPLYRFVSFFDLYDILVNRRLRFSKLSTMQDRNEGIGVILRGQEDAILRQMHIDPARIPKIHTNALENHYISCWTMEAEAISMWSLYSPDSTSIRIATTVQKLNSVLNGLFEDMHWQHCVNEPGSRKPVAWYCQLEPVEYINYIRVRDEIRTKFRAFRERTSEAARSRIGYYESENGFKKDWIEFHSEKVLSRDGLFLKDEAFFHEREVRACLYCGVRNDITVESFRERNNVMENLFTGANIGELPNFAYANVDSSFLDSICFDPRMRSYKRSVYQDALSSVLPAITESRCFGYILDQANLSSDFDGNPFWPT